MSAPVDLHTLAIVVAALRRSLDFGWHDLRRGGGLDDVIAARSAAHAIVKWGEALCRGEAAEEPEA